MFVFAAWIHQRNIFSLRSASTNPGIPVLQLSGRWWLFRPSLQLQSKITSHAFIVKDNWGKGACFGFISVILASPLVGLPPNRVGGVWVPNHPRSYAVWGFTLLVGSSKADMSRVSALCLGPDKAQPEVSGWVGGWMDILASST